MYLMTYQKIPLFVLLFNFQLFLTPYIGKPDSSRDLSTFMVSFKYSFENTNVAVPDPKTFI